MPSETRSVRREQSQAETGQASKESEPWIVTIAAVLRRSQSDNMGMEYTRYPWIGKQRAHIVRAEQALGKPLPKGAVVHHADGSRSPHAPLVICQDSAYHQLLHLRMKVVAVGGDPNTEKFCNRCRKAKPFSQFYARQSTGQRMPNCRACCYQRRAPHICPTCGAHRRSSFLAQRHTA